MLESRPPRTPGTTFGFVLIAGLILLDLGLLLLLVDSPISGLSVLWGGLILATFPAVATIAFWTSSLAATRYHVEDDALVIEWGRIRQLVPLGQITSITVGRDLIRVAQFRGARWPGCFVGHGYTEVGDDQSGPVETLFLATRPVREQVLVRTPDAAYALSPVDLDNFADCLQALRTPGATIISGRQRSDLGHLTWGFWQDRWALLTLAVAILLNAAMFAYLALVYRDLPVMMPLHFDGQGVVDRMTSSRGLFVLPSLGLLSWLFNGLLGWYYYQQRREVPIAFIVWGAAIAVQLATWTAVLALLAAG